jgi:bacterioferritin-associated ferredoxin
MYVCLCKGITDSAIRNAVSAGASTFKEVRYTLGVATQCGKCACSAKEVIAEAAQYCNSSDIQLAYAVA